MVTVEEIDDFYPKLTTGEAKLLTNLIKSHCECISTKAIMKVVVNKQGSITKRYSQKQVIFKRCKLLRHMRYVAIDCSN